MLFRSVNTFTKYSTGADNEILLITVIENGAGINEQVITADIDGITRKIYLPTEDPYIITGEKYYVAEDGSTYYFLFGGNGNVVAPSDAIDPANLARAAS